MELIDSRRLTGPNIVWNHPGAVIDIRFGDNEPDEVIDTWKQQLGRMLKAVGWDALEVAVHRVPGGASLVFAAPIDALYAGTDINDWAWEATCKKIQSGNDVDPGPDAARLKDTITEERNPRLQALRAAAETRDKVFLSDDDDVSIGLGCNSLTFPAADIPSAEDITWDSIAAIPVGLVTGTNGKTTSVRLAASIARAAGHRAGLSSTDWIAVDGDIIDRGDYSGPGGARTILRDRRVTLAILETARGGLLRRGLAINYADAALITNIAEDHLGDFGVQDLEQLADVKWIVTRALGPAGYAILNAEDPRLVVRATRSSGFKLLWFSTDPDNPTLRDHVNRDGWGLTVENHQLLWYRDGNAAKLIDVREIPVTLRGAARHNVANALGAAGLMLALGVDPDAVISGLTGLLPEDNPGRCNLYHIGDVDVLVDFAHNPHGMAALFELAREYPANRRLLIIGQAGDRSDEAIRELTRSAWSIGIDHVIIKEMAQYARGRQRGEIPALIRGEFLKLGAAEDSIGYQEHEMDAVKKSLDMAGKGDLVIMLIHENMDAVTDYLRSRKDA